MGKLGAPFKQGSGFACQFSFRPRSLRSLVVSRFDPSIAVMDLGFQIQGLLQEEENFSPSVRFEFLFNLGVCQVSNLLLHLITFFFVLLWCLLASLLLCDCTGFDLFPGYFVFSLLCICLGVEPNAS